MLLNQTLTLTNTRDHRVRPSSAPVRIPALARVGLGLKILKSAGPDLRNFFRVIRSTDFCH